MENEKNYNVESVDSLRSGLGLGVNAGHTVSVVGRKAAAFKDRMLSAVKNGFGKAKAKLVSAKDAVVDFTKEKTTQISNSVDAHAYHLAQEDYQKIMSNKTAKLDEKIANIKDKIVAIKNATIGLGKGQVKDEKDRSYLLHKSEDILKGYTQEKAAIESEMTQLDNYEKGQDTRIKVSGKRKILIGALDLKRIVSNVAKATLGVGKKAVASAGKIADSAKKSMSSMQERIAERKIEKETKKALEAEAKKQAELAKMSPEELLNEFGEEDLPVIEQYANLVNKEIFNMVELFNNNISIKNEKDAIAKAHPEVAKFVEATAAKKFSPMEAELRNENKVISNKVDKLFVENPKVAIGIIKEFEAKEEEKEKEISKASEEAYNRGKEDGMASMKAEMEAMKKQMDEMRSQIASMNSSKETKKTAKAEKAEKDLSKLTKAQLLELAKDIKGATKMNKADLIDAIDTNKAKK